MHRLATKGFPFNHVCLYSLINLEWIFLQQYWKKFITAAFQFLTYISEINSFGGMADIEIFNGVHLNLIFQLFI